jgi:hypothetical protein
MRCVKGYSVILALILTIAIVQPALALPAMSIPFLTVGMNEPMVIVNPQQAAALLIIETNTTHLACTDTEALAISFPPVHAADTQRTIFAPAIAQTTSQAIVGDRTYTFADFTTI